MVTPQDEGEHKIVSETIIPYKEWKKVMEEEMKSVKKNQVQELIDLPNGCKAIGNKEIL